MESPVEPTFDPALEPTGKIPLLPWMTAAETRAVIAALTAEGAEVRFVGGCVRDSVLKRPIGDIDVATPDPPQKVIELLERAGIRAVPTGIDHGTVTAVVGEAHFEVTTLRVDVETYGRRAKVSFTDDWMADAARRDFTINTLSCTPEGDIFDPFGKGLGDLGNERVRFVGNARDRVEEDLLRLLRYFRFHATYGRPPPDTDALAACRALAHRLPELSGERVRDELFLILLAPAPADIALLMRGERVLDHVLPEAGDVGRLRAMAWLDSRAIKMETVLPDALRRLGSLLDTDAAGAEAVAERLRLSKAQKERLTTLAVAPLDVTAGMSDYQLRRALYRLGPDTVRDLALLYWARSLAVAPRQPRRKNEAWQGILETAAAWTPLRFPLKGQDALDLGVAAGPRVGALLEAVEEWWEEGDYRADHAACLEKLGALIDGGG